MHFYSIKKRILFNSDFCDLENTFDDDEDKKKDGENSKNIEEDLEKPEVLHH